MRHLIAVLAVLALGAGVAPASAAELPPVDCGPDDGREQLTPAGFTLDFDAPAVAVPELVSPVDTRVPPLSPHRTATFPFTANLAPAASATLIATLDWENPSDYDLYVLNPEGERLAASDQSNIDGQTTSEQLSMELSHCQQITVWVRNWAGSPAETLHLNITVQPGSTLLACAEGDSAPGCAGKAAGEAPEFTPDTRTRLFLGGDPGQVSMVHAYQGNGAPFRGTLETQRPTGGLANSHTRALVGFHDQYQNPLVPHFTTTFVQPRDVVGDVTAWLWLQSATTDATSRFYVTLWVDSSPASTQIVPGSAIGPNAAAVAVSFPDVDFEQASSVTLQAATAPVANSNGNVGNPADAQVTVLYDSVQFQSRVTLP